MPLPDQKTKIMQQKSVRFLLVASLLNTANSYDSSFVTECITPNNEIGHCLEIQGCKKLLLQVELNHTSSFEFIRASRCGPGNEDITKSNVCCGPHINFVHRECITPNKKMGLCLEMLNCEKLLLQVIYRNTPTFKFIRDSQCGNRNSLASTTKVCCGPDINFVQKDDSGDAPPQTYRTTTTITTPIPSSGNDILPRMCGTQKIFMDDKISDEAGVREFPWLARLIHLNKYNETRFGCTAFLIHNKFLLTAAHCFVGEGVKQLGPLHGVILGRQTDTKEAIRMLTPIIHNGYDSTLFTHNIALIPLADKVNFTGFIKAVCVSRIPTKAPFLTTSSWVGTEADGGINSKLKVEFLPISNHTECGEQYGSLGLPITDMQLCVGGKVGPLMALGEDGLWYAEGLVNFGKQGWPAVYTNITGYYNWIVENIQTVLNN